MIVLYLVLLIGVFLFLAKMAVRYSTQVTRRMVENRFRAAEAIVNERRLPESWVGKLTVSPGAGVTGNSSEEKAKRKLLHRLDALTKFFETSPFFDSKDTRELMITRLDEVYQDWQEKPLAEILVVYGASNTPDT